MDFQTHQHQARQGTTRLVVLFITGLLAIMVLVAALVAGLLYYSTRDFDPLPAIGIAAPLTIVGVGGASLTKLAQIKGGGGSYVATSMGGRAVDFNTLDPAEKQLSNIVEEMAIASGLPVPAVYVLDNEPGINAFAAGWTADNAAIGVTRGALQHLNRAELQGVVAHEFAHIANGDTRIKTRIIGWVFGIAILTVLGRLLLESLWYAPRRRRSSRGDNDNGLVFALMAAGMGLLIIGAVGTFFARMIQAAVSRQRELLADASAVQFTRNPDGLADALSKIGGLAEDNRIISAHSVESSHLFFSSPMAGMFSSHPPLRDRITRLAPTWDGEFRAPDPRVAKPAQAPNKANAAGWGTQSGQLPGGQVLPGSEATKALPFDPIILMGGALGGEASGTGASGTGVPAGDATGEAPASPAPGPAATPANTPPTAYQPPQLGGPTPAHIEHARVLLSRIPADVQNYLHTRAGAVASVLGLLASDGEPQRAADLAAAAKTIGLDASYVEAAGAVISRLDRNLQLPAIDIALHSIRELPWDYRDQLRDTVLAIESSRPDHDLFRWMLRRVLLRHLEDQHDTGSAKHDLAFDPCHDDVVVVLAAVAWFNSSGTDWGPGAFASGLAAAGMPARELPATDSLSVDRLDAALERLSHLDQPGRVRFVEAAMAIVAHDATTTADEAELIRVIADAVRLPMPPLLPA